MLTFKTLAKELGAEELKAKQILPSYIPLP
jgi:hypothetical protein